MALPALVPLAGKIVAWTGGTALLKRSAPKIKGFVSNAVPKARGAFNSLSQNARAALGLGAGTAGGFGAAELFDRLGIEDQRLQRLSLLGLAVVALFAIGQLFNFDVQL